MHANAVLWVWEVHFSVTMYPLELALNIVGRCERSDRASEANPKPLNLKPSISTLEAPPALHVSYWCLIRTQAMLSCMAEEIVHDTPAERVICDDMLHPQSSLYQQDHGHGSMRPLPGLSHHHQNTMVPDPVEGFC